MISLVLYALKSFSFIFSSLQRMAISYFQCTLKSLTRVNYVFYSSLDPYIFQLLCLRAQLHTFSTSQIVHNIVSLNLSTIYSSIVNRFDRIIADLSRVIIQGYALTHPLFFGSEQTFAIRYQKPVLTASFARLSRELFYMPIGFSLERKAITHNIAQNERGTSKKKRRCI